MLRPLVYSFFIFISLIGCIDPFDPDLPSALDNPELVVEGFITDYEPVQIVKLTRTQAVNDDTPSLPETGATITLSDSLGNNYFFVESSAGTYTIDSSIFQPQYGNFYKININLSDGSSFSSDFQELKASLPIDSIWHRVETETIIVDDVPSIEEYVKLYTYLEESENVRFFYSGTYRYIAPYQGLTFCWVSNPPDPATIPDFLVCYLPNQSNDLLNLLSGNDVTDPVNTERNVARMIKDRRFSIGFNILLEKFTLTDSYYEYLSQIEAQSEDQGGLFDPPPTEIFGNIVSDDDPTIVARGFFTAVSKAEKRILLDNVGFDDSNDPNCMLIELFDGRLIPNEKHCCDCRLFPGAQTIRPSYWDN